jgi:heptosyltransferase-2
MSDLVDRDFERILIIKPSSIGDVMHALPVLNGLRRRYPDAKISWLLSTACADLLNGHDALDEVIPFERKHFGRMWRSPSALVGFLRFIRDLRRRRFDLVIDLQGLFRSGFVTRASGAATRIGPDNSRELAGVFYTDRVAIPTLEEHAVDRYYRVAPMLGFADVPITFTLPVAETERVNAHGLLQVRGVDPDRYALVFASARWETKVWPVDRFAELVDGLQERLGLAVVLMGGRTDATNPPDCST